MAQGAGRIACPRCGANNFDTVTVCWKCAAALTAGLAPGQHPPAATYPHPAPPAYPSYPSAPEFPQQHQRADRSSPALGFVAAATGVIGNPGAANRAAFWLGVLMPYFGFPIGLAFMMCDDRRRQEVGRICILWSVVSGIVHLLVFFVSLLGMRSYFELVLGGLRSQIDRTGGGLDAGL